MMKTRIFGDTGAGVSEIGLGCWQIGGLCWGDIDESSAFEILGASVDSGVNFFDTADVYGTGRSETLIGKFLKGCSQEIFIATKLGRFPEPGGPENYSRNAFRQHTEASLTRLGVDALDVTQLHCIPTVEMAKGEVFQWLRELKQEGKIRAFGASVESMDEANLCLEQEGITSLQIIFNIFRQKPIETLFEKAKAKKVALIVRLPLASGLLTGKMTSQTTFPENDHRTFNRNGEMFNVGETFAGLPLEKGIELADRIKRWTPAGMTMAAMSLRWILDHDAVSVVIPGASRVEQAISNAAVSDLEPLSEQLHQQLGEFYVGEVAEHIRGPY